jgi:transcriptional regulator with XRE-family HTH domain
VSQPIKKHWESRRLTQRDLARQVEIDHVRLNEILQGHRRPNSRQRERLSKFFGLPESELFDDWARNEEGSDA